MFTQYTIAVTGGGSGIGLAICIALSLQGATVYAADIRAEAPPELDNYENIHFVGGCDIISREACKAFLDSITGRLDGMVNCVGICPSEGKMASDDKFNQIMAVNVLGTWNIGTEAIIRMSEQDERNAPGCTPGSQRTLGSGTIVNMASGAGLRGIAGVPAYCASKHAVVGLTRAWAKEWSTLRINAVAPGLTDTPLIRGTEDVGGDKSCMGRFAAQLAGENPLGRLAYPSDVADATLFLLSGAASFVTGQVIPVNGGNF